MQTKISKELLSSRC